MAAGSSMLATIRTVPPQWTQAVTSMEKTRLRRCAQLIERRFSSGLRGASFALASAGSTRRHAACRAPMASTVRAGRRSATPLEAGQVGARWRDQRRQLGDEIHRIPFHMRGAIAPRRLELIPHPTLTANGVLLGLAHYRPFPEPLLGKEAGFLDDLLVLPEQRGGGLGRRLIEAVAQAGKEQGWPFLRWITAQDNAQARRLYDGLAQATAWVTYDLSLGTAC